MKAVLLRTIKFLWHLFASAEIMICSGEEKCNISSKKFPPNFRSELMFNYMYRYSKWQLSSRQLFCLIRYENMLQTSVYTIQIKLNMKNQSSG